MGNCFIFMVLCFYHHMTFKAFYSRHKLSLPPGKRGAE